MAAKKGEIIKISYEGREFEVIVIGPNGLGKGQPSVGFGYGMMEEHSGIPQSTLSTWGYRENEERWLKLPSGKAFRVIDIRGLDGNDYMVIEASDWFDIAFDLLESPGRTGVRDSEKAPKKSGTEDKSLKSKLLKFIRWFTIKGFYAEAYTVIKGVYTAKDSRALSAWMEQRLGGIYNRKLYTDFLQAQDCQARDYGNWTNYAYIGLFAMKASEMKQIWQVVEGDFSIARNHIPEAIGLEAVAYCEKMVPQLFVESLKQAHDDAISYTKRKFFDGSLADFSNLLSGLDEDRMLN